MSWRQQEIDISTILYLSKLVEGVSLHNNNNNNNTKKLLQKLLRHIDSL